MTATARRTDARSIAKRRRGLLMSGIGFFFSCSHAERGNEVVDLQFPQHFQPLFGFSGELVGGMFLGNERVKPFGVGNEFGSGGSVLLGPDPHFRAAARFEAGFGLPVLGFSGSRLAAVAEHGPLEFANRFGMLLLLEVDFPHHEPGAASALIAGLA